MKPESISEKMMYNTVRLETESGMGTGFFYNFHVGDATYPTIITNKHVVNYKQDEKGGIIRMCEQVAASGNTLILYSA